MEPDIDALVCLGLSFVLSSQIPYTVLQRLLRESLGKLPLWPAWMIWVAGLSSVLSSLPAGKSHPLDYRVIDPREPLSVPAAAGSSLPVLAYTTLLSVPSFFKFSIQCGAFWLTHRSGGQLWKNDRPSVDNVMLSMGVFYDSCAKIAHMEESFRTSSLFYTPHYWIFRGLASTVPYTV